MEAQPLPSMPVKHLSLTATTIIAVRTPAIVYIGADSKVSNIDEIPVNMGPVSKIHAVGDVTFAQSGWFQFGSDETVDIDFVSITRSCLVGSFPLGLKVQEFERAMKAAITRAITELDAVPGAARRGVPVIETLFVAFERGESIASQRSFRLKSMIPGAYEIEIIRQDCPGDCGPSGLGQMIMGERSALDAALAAAPYRNGIAEGIRRLIEIEAAAHPSTVGGPISVMSITAAGREWEIWSEASD